MNYALLLFLFLLLEIYYFKLASFFEILDYPKERGMHSVPTIRGGGIIFYISTFFFFLFNDFQYPYFFIGISVLALISFLDDIHSLPNRIRIIFHIASIVLTLIELQTFLEFDWVIFVSFLFLGTAILNSFNFMDGINGITGVYSLVTVLTLGYLNTLNLFVDINLWIYTVLGILVFLFYNFRGKAVCFGGDVGSFSIAMIIFFLLFKLILMTSSYKYIFFLFLYGFDTLYTLVHRIFLRQNIFKAHKLHFFQLLVSHYGYNQLMVSLAYAIIQVLLNVWVFYVNWFDFLFYAPFFGIFVIMHLMRKKVDMHISLGSKLIK